MSKTFVLDTNVLLHDPEALLQFEDNDVVIPLAVIIELDGLKRGHGEIPASARRSLRLIDDFRRKGDLAAGVELPGKGRIRVDTGDRGMDVSHQSADNSIVLTAVRLKVNNPDAVVMVSKDTAVRIKAETLGVSAENYRSDKSTIFQKCGRLIKAEDSLEEFGSVRYRSTPSGLERAVGKGEWGALEEKGDPMGIAGRNPEQQCALDALTARSVDVVALTGRAGTGKTLLALAAGIELCTRMRAKTEGAGAGYEQVMVARPIVPMGNDLGYLPGEVGEKLLPWMQPIYDNLDVIVGTPGEGKDSNPAFKYRSADYLIESGVVHIEPLTYIRGRSLPRRYLIIDEAQNLRPLDVKTIITRCGEGTKAVFTGDLDQIDQPYLDATSNGLSYLISRFINEANFCYLNLTISARSPLAEQGAELL
jgi:PhoH-like ATPase